MNKKTLRFIRGNLRGRFQKNRRRITKKNPVERSTGFPLGERIQPVSGALSGALWLVSLGDLTVMVRGGSSPPAYPPNTLMGVKQSELLHATLEMPSLRQTKPQNG